MNQQPDSDTERQTQPTWRGALFAAAYGAITVTVAYLLARGNPIAMLAIIVVIGILFRVYAYTLIRRHGTARPPWWKWF